MNVRSVVAHKYCTACAPYVVRRKKRLARSLEGEEHGAVVHYRTLGGDLQA